MSLNNIRESEKPHSKNLLTTPAGRFIETRSYLQILSFGLSVLAISTLYFALAGDGQGLYSSESTSQVPPFSWMDALYFSVVTFTTTGYGDLVPVGFGRLIATGDALMGLAVAALLIGKLASERQYSMLLLLHTSDCERRISGFSIELGAVTSSLQQAEKTANSAAVYDYMEAAVGHLNAVNNYIVFHLNQSRLAVFGNHTSLRFLCEKMLELQDRSASIFRSGLPDRITGQRCKVLVERVAKLIRLIEAHSSVEGRSATSFAKTAESRSEKLLQWANSKLTAWSIDRVYDELPTDPIIKWHSNLYKEVARKLGISNTLTKKCIDHLLQIGRIRLR